MLLFCVVCMVLIRVGVFLLRLLSGRCFWMMDVYSVRCLLMGLV